MIVSRVSFLLMLLSTSNVMAANWSVQSAIYFSEAYSDNPDYAVAGKEKSSLISEVTPSVNVTAEGSSFSYDLSYAPRFYYQDGEDVSRSITHPLDTNLQVDIVGSSLKVVSGGTISRYYNDAGKGLIGGDGNPDEKGELRRFFIGPHLDIKLNPSLYLNTSYTFDYVKQVGTLENMTRGKKLLISLGSGATTSDYIWSLDFNDYRVDVESDLELRSTTTSLMLGYRVTKKLRTHLTGGYEQQSGSENIEFDDSYHGGGLNWDPNSAVSLALSCTKRSYTRQCQMNADYTGRRLFSGLSISESLTYGRDQGVLVGAEECVEGDEACKLREEIRILTAMQQTDDVFENQYIQFYGGLILNKITLTGKVSRTQRDFLELNHIERLYEGVLGLSFKYSLKAHFSFDLIKQHNGAVDSTLVSTSYRYQKTSTASLDVSLQGKKNSSNVDADNFHEKRITVGLNITL